MRNSKLFFLPLATALLVNSASFLPAAVTDADQQSLHSQYVGKVLIFRKCARMVGKYDVQEDGTVTGNYQPGYWAMDGAAQVKDIDFAKDRVTFKCAKLWANIRNDGNLHYFPAAAALKGKSGDYPLTTDIIFRTGSENVSAADIVTRLHKLCLGEQESPLTTAPQAINAFIANSPVPADIGSSSAGAFKGTAPKAISNPTPDTSQEADLVRQSGQESFVVYVDEHGTASVVGFTRILQYGLEETTIAAVRGWKFEPATLDGKPVGVRIAMSIAYKLPSKK